MRCTSAGRRLRTWLVAPGRRPWGKPAAYPWRCRRGTVGRPPRRSVNGEPGKRPTLPAPQPSRLGAARLVASWRGAWRSLRSSPRVGEPLTWRRRAAISQQPCCTGRRSPMNIGARWPTSEEAKVRVLRMQTKLHCWAGEDHDRQFDDLYNLVYDPAFLTTGWEQVKSNKGARSAGVDGVTVRDIERRGTEAFLEALQADLRRKEFHPQPVRERMIPQGQRQVAPTGHPDGAGPGRASDAQDGAGAHLREGLSTFLVRVSAWPTSAGCRRRDCLLWQPHV